MCAWAVGVRGGGPTRRQCHSESLRSLPPQVPTGGGTASPIGRINICIVLITVNLSTLPRTCTAPRWAWSGPAGRTHRAASAACIVMSGRGSNVGAMGRNSACNPAGEVLSCCCPLCVCSERTLFCRSIAACIVDLVRMLLKVARPHSVLHLCHAPDASGGAAHGSPPALSHAGQWTQLSQI